MGSDYESSIVSGGSSSKFDVDKMKAQDGDTDVVEDHARLLTGLLGVLFTVSKEKALSWKFVTFRLALDWLQLWLLMVSPAYGFTGWIDSSNTGWQVVSFINLNQFMSARGYTFFLACLYVMTAGLLINIGFCVWVGHSFQNNRFDHVWPIAWLRYFSLVFYQVLDIASLTLFLITLDCGYYNEPEEAALRNQEFPDQLCFTMPHLVHVIVAVIALLIFVGLSGIFQLAEIELDLGSRNLMGMAHTKVEVYGFGVKFVMTAANVFLNNYKHYAVAQLLLSLLLLYLYARYVPHLSDIINIVRVGTYASVAYAAIILVVITCTSTSGKTPDEVSKFRDDMTIAMWAGIVPAFGLGALMAWLRLRRFKVTLLNRFRDAPPDTPVLGIYRFSDPREVEIMARCCRKWQVDDSLDPDAVAMAEVIMKAGMEQLPHNCYMIVLYASFLIDVQSSNQSGYTLLQSAKKANPSFLERFAVFSREQQHTQQSANSVPGATTDLVAYVELQRNYRLALRVHKESLIAIRTFWLCLLHANVKFEELSRTMKRIDLSVKQAERVYRTVLQRHANNVRLLRLYGKFMEFVKNDPWAASKWYTEADKLEQAEEDARKSNMFGDVDTNDPSVASALAALGPGSDGRAIVVMNAQCIIQITNRAAPLLFGYSGSNELVGKNVNILVPPPFADQHNGSVRKYLASGQEKVMNTSFTFAALHKERHVFPVATFITKISGFGEDAMFMGMIETQPGQPDVATAWIQPSNDLVSADKNFHDWLGYRPDDVVGAPLEKFVVDWHRLEAVLHDVHSTITSSKVHTPGRAEAQQHRAQTASTSSKHGQRPVPPGQWVLQDVQLKHKYASPVTMDAIVTYGGVGSFQVYLLTMRRRLPPSQCHMLVADPKGSLLHVTQDLAALLGTTPRALMSGGHMLEALMYGPYAAMHRSLATSVPMAEPPPHSCRAGLPVLLQTGGIGQEPEVKAFRLQVASKAAMDEAVHIVSLRAMTLEQALSERRLVVHCDRHGTIVEVEGGDVSDPDNIFTPLTGQVRRPGTNTGLFGFDPAELMGQNISRFVDVLKGGTAPSEVTTGALLTRLAAISTEAIGAAWRVGVEAPFDEAGALELGELAEAVMGQRIRPAILQVELQTMDVIEPPKPRPQAQPLPPPPPQLLPISPLQRAPSQVSPRLFQHAPSGLPSQHQANGLSSGRNSEGLMGYSIGKRPAPVAEGVEGVEEEEELLLVHGDSANLPMPIPAAAGQGSTTAGYTAGLPTPPPQLHGSAPPAPRVSLGSLEKMLAGPASPRGSLRHVTAPVRASLAQQQQEAQAPVGRKPAVPELHPDRLRFKVTLWHAQVCCSVIDVDSHGIVVGSNNGTQPENYMFARGLMFGAPSASMLGAHISQFLPLGTKPVTDLLDPSSATLGGAGAIVVPRPGEAGYVPEGQRHAHLARRRSVLKQDKGSGVQKNSGPTVVLEMQHWGDGRPVQLAVQAVPCTRRSVPGRGLNSGPAVQLVVRLWEPAAHGREDFAAWVMGGACQQQLRALLAPLVQRTLQTHSQVPFGGLTGKGPSPRMGKETSVSAGQHELLGAALTKQLASIVSAPQPSQNHRPAPSLRNTVSEPATLENLEKELQLGPSPPTLQPVQENEEELPQEHSSAHQHQQPVRRSPLGTSRLGSASEQELVPGDSSLKKNLRFSSAGQLTQQMTQQQERSSKQAQILEWAASDARAVATGPLAHTVDMDEDAGPEVPDELEDSDADASDGERANSANNNGSSAGEEIDEAGTMTAEATDYRRGQRFKKLSRLLAGAEIQRTLAHFKVHNLIVMAVLLVVHVALFAMLYVMTVKQSQTVNDLHTCGAAMRKVGDVVIMVRTIQLLFSNRGEAWLYGFTGPQDIERSRAYLKTIISSYETLHTDFYLGPDGSPRALPASYGLLRLWQDNTINETIAVQGGVNETVASVLMGNSTILIGDNSTLASMNGTFVGKMPYTAVTQLTSLWNMGNSYIRAGSLFYQNCWLWNATGRNLRDWEVYRYVMDNTVVEDAYAESLDALLQLSFEGNTKVTNLQIAVLVAEGVALVGLATAYMWVLSERVMGQRYNMYFVFMLLPLGMLRGLATRKLDLGDSDDEDDDVAVAGGPAGGEASAPQGLPATPGRPGQASNGGNEYGIDMMANGRGLHGAQASGRGGGPATLQKFDIREDDGGDFDGPPGPGASSGAGLMARIGELIGHSSGRIAPVGGGSKSRSVRGGRRRLMRSLKPTVAVTWPFVAYGLLIVILTVIAYKELAAVNSPVALFNMVNHVSAGVKKEYALVQDIVQKTDPAQKEAVRVELRAMAPYVMKEYLVMLYGAEILPGETSPHFTLVPQGLVHSSGPGPYLLYRTKDCLADLTQMGPLCKAPNDPYYADTRNGVARLVEKFFSVANVIANMTGTDPDMKGPEWAWLYSTRSDLAGGCVSLIEVYKTHVDDVYKMVLNLQVVAFTLPVVLLLACQLFAIRPFLKSSANEIRRIAELLSQLPADVDVEGLLASVLMRSRGVGVAPGMVPKDLESGGAAAGGAHLHDAAVDKFNGDKPASKSFATGRGASMHV